MLDRTRKRVGHEKKEQWGMGEEEDKGSRNGESIDLLGWHVTIFHTKSCMLAYEW